MDKEIAIDEDIRNRMLDVKEIANTFNISTRTVWRAVARGNLPSPVRIGRCCRWFLEDVLSVKRRLLEERKKLANR